MKLLLPLFLLVAACGSPDVSFNTLEEAKTTARDNSLYNAQLFRQASAEYKDWSIESRGDSSQTPDCPQGDGWATLKMVSPDVTRKMNIKCSTVSSATGCLPEDEFKSKPYAADDGHCQPVEKVPHPLPKIAK